MGSPRQDNKARKRRAGDACRHNQRGYSGISLEACEGQACRHLTWAVPADALRDDQCGG
jgi:hypothetical protein